MIESSTPVRIVGICGLANSGKDTVADYLVANYGFVSIHVADPLKRFVKKVFDLSTDDLWGPSHRRNELIFRSAGEDYWRECRARLSAYKSDFALSLSPGVSTLPDYQSFIDLVESTLPKWFDNLYKTHFGALSTRHILQTLGTDWGRNMISKTIWVDYLEYAIEKTVNLPETWAYVCDQGFIDTKKLTRPINGIVVPDIRFQNEADVINNLDGHVILLQRDSVATLNHESENFVKEVISSKDIESFSLVLSNSHSLDDLKDAVDVFVNTCLIL